MKEVGVTPAPNASINAMGHSFIYSITFVLILLLFTTHNSLIHLNRILNENIFLILIEIFRFSLILSSPTAKKETQQYSIECFWLLIHCSSMCTSVLHPFDGLNTETNQSCQLINIGNRMSAHFKHFYSILRCENQLTDWILVFARNLDHRTRIRKHAQRERGLCVTAENNKITKELKQKN